MYRDGASFESNRLLLERFAYFKARLLAIVSSPVASCRVLSSRKIIVDGEIVGR
jgi:hypothetical protein